MSPFFHKSFSAVTRTNLLITPGIEMICVNVATCTPHTCKKPLGYFLALRTCFCNGKSCCGMRSEYI